MGLWIFNGTPHSKLMNATNCIIFIYIYKLQHFQKKCKDAGIEDKFDAHQMRLRANYVGVFLMLHLFFTILHCTLLLTTCVVRGWLCIV